ncbi:MAG: glutamate cyclase domain-containing protein [Armatimonadota bacterium]
MLDRLGEYVDQIVNCKLTPHMRTHDAATFYGPARAAQGGRPMTFLAAQALAQRVKEGDYVFILHNAGLPPYLPHGETDGPLGAASLARAVNWALGARPVFVAEPGFRAPIERCAAAAALRIVSRSDVEKYRIYHAAQAIDFPLGPEGAAGRAARLLDDYRPAAILTVERLGPNAMDIFHSGVGYRLPAATQAHVHLLVEQAEARGILTVGFGDGGNEVGYGLIPDVVNALKAEVLGGPTCQCGCGGGIATRVRTTVLVSAATSNWGSYGVSALLAYVARDLDALQDEDMEYRMLEAAVMAGAVDASTGTVVMKVDGTSVKANQAIVTLLRELVANTLREPRPRLFPKEIKEILSAS